LVEDEEVHSFKISCTRREESTSCVCCLISRALYEMHAPWEPMLPPMDPLDKVKYTLVFDMDGTLLTELTKDQFLGNKDVRFCEIDFIIEQHIIGIIALIAIRPYLGQFLESMVEFFEIVKFTERPKKRIIAILDKLPNNSLIQKRLYKDSCIEIEGKLEKDLSLLGRDLRRVVIVYNFPFSYSLQPSNSFSTK